MKQYLSIMTNLAKKAGQVQLDHLGKVKTIEVKEVINIVTEVDKECENLSLHVWASFVPG